MSVIVPCPACPAQLRAPESALGKRIQCPKCGAVVDVPALVATEELPGAAAKAAPARPRPAVADAYADDEEGDTEADRPRSKTRDRDAEDEPPPRRRKKRKAAKSGPDETGLFVFAGVLLVLGVATAIVFLVRKDTPTAARTGTDSPASSPTPNLFGPAAPSDRENPLPAAEAQVPVPAGWQLHSNPDAGFRAHFPRPPITTPSYVKVTGPSGITTSRTEWALYSGGYMGREEDVTIKFWVIRFSSGPPYRVSDQLDYVMPRRAPGVARRVRWLGHAAHEVDQPMSVVRAVAFGDTLVVAQVVGRGEMPPQPHEAAAFFTNIEITK